MKDKVKGIENDNISKCIANIEKKFGKGAIMNFDSKTDKSIKRFSTGSLQIDSIIGGGWPRGRIVEVLGSESGGKSSLALHSAAEVQKEGGVVLYIDTEHSMSPDYAENLGVSLSKNDFIFSQPDYGEQALDIAESFIQSGEVQLIIVDSVAALIPKAELEGEFNEVKVGLHARLMSQAMRKLAGLVNKTDCVLLFINQYRKSIGGMSFYGPNEVPTGGESLKYYASIRIDMRRSGQAEKDDEGRPISNRVKVKVLKNKTFPPFKECFFDIIYGEGIDRVKEIVDLAVQHEIIEKKSSWYSYKNEDGKENKLGQGEDNARITLLNNPKLTDEILEQVKKKAL